MRAVEAVPTADGLDERSRRIERRFEIPMLVAAALVIPTIILEEAGGEPWHQLATALNYLIWTAFLTELVVMLAVVPNRRRWLREHPVEVVVVLFTPPFLLTATQPIRFLRLLRILRLLRLAPLARVIFTLEGVRYAALLALLAILAGGEAYSVVESNATFGDGLWWAVGVMTTVGFGENPTTDTGKALSVALVLVGISFVAVLTGVIAQLFIAPSVAEVEATAEEVAMTEDDLLHRVREIGERLGEVERELERRRALEHYPPKGPAR